MPTSSAPALCPQRTVTNLRVNFHDIIAAESWKIHWNSRVFIHFTHLSSTISAQNQRKVRQQQKEKRGESSLHFHPERYTTPRVSRPTRESMRATD